MCGIAGLVSPNKLNHEDANRVARMSDALVHRGPDSSGWYRAPNLALAARRLSIIDLKGGNQPLFNEDKSLILSANAEIYNHEELRLGLEGQGHRFSSASDCETILHGYEEYGLDFVDHLRGMFAFALWDEKRTRLILARDPMGEKPLYLCEHDGRLLFASEMKALLSSGLVPFEIDPAAIDSYFHYQYVPEPGTPLKGVRKLPAAHLLIVDCEPWSIRSECYWRMEDAPPLTGDAPELIREQMDRVGKLVTRADVPVGVALSGGLDSSAVAAFAVRNSSRELHAFSIGYEGRPDHCDEREDARQLAAHLEMEFHEAEVKIEEVVEFFPDLQFWKDEPIADYAGHAYYAVMRLARERGVPVILQGQGGDELFWGYPQLRQAARETTAKQALGRGLLKAIPQYLSLVDVSEAVVEIDRVESGEVNRVLSAIRQMRKHRATPSTQMIFYDASPDYAAAAIETPGIYGSQFSRQLGESKVSELFKVALPWRNVDVTLTRLVSETYLRCNGITQGDRLAMASSIEMRLPLLDRDLVETVIGLRKAKSDLQLPPKDWLKRAAATVLPEWVMNRPKRGFTPPVAEWHASIFAAHGKTLRDGELMSLGVLNPASAERLSAGPYPPGLSSPISFKALVLELWCRQMKSVVENSTSGCLQEQGQFA